ncbi:LysR family transcriptional regulator [Gulosibacter molinativorax]|uniref:LysR family transcriptional regulator n=1 Tax=Gulosibacter molinativorax TaxID=256821 RepID=A0ABT7C8V1_9MICO|nr:LysR family transcriptional regulator [Gulosibacter molinativorax]MDJ1371157.1 LysR family transcriptional regulator [Gulosibacter molinativorax]QUY62973.1 LysR family transcriptional regulator [Gulosibacter molinativorax]
MKWTLDQLRTFVAIADHGSMSAASQALGYTPGALSQQMHALRSAVGVDIFVRDGRSLELSDVGQTLLTHARLLLEAERLAVRAVSGPTSELDLRVELGVFGSAAVAAIRPAMARLREVAPNITLLAREVDVERMPEAVAQREIDVALGLTYDAAANALPRGVTAQTVKAESFLIALTPDLEAVRNEASIAEIANAKGWILPPADSEYGRAARLACEAAGIEPIVRHIVTDTAVSLAMAESGLGVTLATPLMMGLSAGRIPVAPLPGDSKRNIAVIARRGAGERESVRTVMEVLGEVFR